MNTWANDKLVPNDDNAIGISGIPGAAVFNNRIYLFHQGRSNDGRIWYSTFDGSFWSDDQLARPNNPYQIDGSPAVAVYNGKIYCFYRSGSDLFYFWFDGQYWSHYKLLWFGSGGGIAGSPGAAVYKEKMYVVCRSGSSYNNTDNYLMCIAGILTGEDLGGDSRGVGNDRWSQPTGGSSQYDRIGYADGSPSLTVYRDKLYCFHKGNGEKFNTELITEVANETIEIALELGDDPKLAAVALGLGSLVIAGAAIGEAIKLNNSNKSDWTWVVSFDGKSWGEDQLCPTAEDAYGVNGESVAAISYQDRLICIRQGRNNSYLWCGEYVGGKWIKDQQMGVSGNTFCASGAPALAVLNDTLYCFYQGKDDIGWVWMTSVRTPPTIKVYSDSGTNIALNKPTRSSSNEVPYLFPSNAVDGNPSTRWASGYYDPQWIEVDLGVVCEINQVVLSWESAYGRDFQIQTSNDCANWTTIISVTGNTSLVNYLPVSGSGRFIRMYGTARSTPYGYSLYEFQVYSPPAIAPGAYQIRSIWNGLCITAQGDSYNPGVPIVSEFWKSLNTQIFNLIPLGNNEYQFQIKHGEMNYLTAPGDSTNAGLQLVQEPWKGWNTQIFRVNPMPSDGFNSFSIGIKHGEVNFLTANDYNTIVQAPWQNTPNQKFLFTRV